MAGRTWAAATLLLVWAECAGAAANGPEFEVAYVRLLPQSQPEFLPGRGAMPIPRVFRTARVQGGPGTEDPGQITCKDCPLTTLIARAYEVGQPQVETQIEWIEAQTYDVIAKVPRGSTRHEVNLMLQRLLADRFRLVVHIEKKAAPVYALLADKRGTHLRAAAPAELPSIKPHLAGTNLSLLEGRGVSMPQLADTLSRYEDLQVVDATGITGKYDFLLGWIASPWEPGPKKKDLPPGFPRVPHTVKDAVRILLGLKLEVRRMPAAVVIVDSALRTPVDTE